jgi:hypothetical protein
VSRQADPVQGEEDPRARADPVGAVVDDDAAVVADPQPLERGGHRLRLRHLQAQSGPGVVILRRGQVAEAHVPPPRDVLGDVRLLGAHVEQDQVRVIEVLGQPLGRHEQVVPGGLGVDGGRGGQGHHRGQPGHGASGAWRAWSIDHGHLFSG